MEDNNIMEQASNMARISQKIEAVKADIEALNVLREVLKDALVSGSMTTDEYNKELQKLFRMVSKNRDLLNDLYLEA